MFKNLFLVVFVLLFSALSSFAQTALQHLESGKKHLIQKNYDAAIKSFTDCVNNDPSVSECFRERGKANLAKNEHNIAIADFTKTIRLNPKDIEAFQQRSNAYSKLKKYTEAIADISKVIEFNPQNATAYLTRANLYMENDDEDGAEIDLIKASQLNPKDAKIQSSLANLYYKNKQTTKAISTINLAIQIDPQNAEYIADRATFYLELEKNDLAMADAKKALTLNPKSKKAKEVLESISGEFIRKAFLGNPSLDNSLANCNKAIELYPDNSRAFWCRSDVYTAFYLKEKDKDYLNLAIKDISKAIELAPNLLLLYEQRSKLQTESGNHSASFADLTKAIEIYPKLSEEEKKNSFIGQIYFRRGTISLENKNYDMAIEDFGKVISLGNGPTASYHNRGLAYEAINKPDLALADYWLALENGSKTSFERIKILELEKPNLTYDDYLAIAQKHNQATKLVVQHRTIASIALGKAIAIKPSAELYKLRGKTNIEANLFTEAINDLTSAINLNPKDAELYKLRATAYEKSGDKQKSLNDLDAVTKLNPNDTDSKYAKIEALYQNAIKKKDLALAIEADKEFERLFKSDKSVETALDRIWGRYNFYDKTTLDIDNTYCGKQSWVSEAMSRFQKDFKNYQGKEVADFKEFIANTEKVCVGSNLNPFGEYYYKMSDSKTYNGTPEQVDCTLTLGSNKVFKKVCGFPNGNMLLSETTGEWKAINGNQVELVETYSNEFNNYEQRYKTYGKKNLNTYIYTITKRGLDEPKQSYNIWKLVCGSEYKSFYCQ